MSEEGNEEDKLKIRKTEEPQQKGRKITMKDAIWIGPLIGFTIVIFKLWGLLGIGIATIGIIAILVGIFLLAGINTLFTSIPQTAAIGIMYGSGEKSRLHRLVQIDKQGKTKAQNAEGVAVEPLWFEKKFNIWWLGIPFLGRLYEHTLQLFEEKIEEITDKNGEIETIITRRTVEKTLNFISLKETPYKIVMPPILCADNYDVIVFLVVFAEVIDAKKALFNIENFLEALITEIQSMIREDIGVNTLDELKKKKSEISDNTIINLRKKKEGRKESEYERFQNEWGLTLKAIGILDITPESEMLKAIKAKAVATVNADAKAEEGRGQKQYLTHIGEGDAAAITARFKAIKGLGNLGVHLRELDVSEKYAEGPNKMYISIPEIGKFLNGAHTQKSTPDTNGIDTEAIKSILPMLTAAGITALTLEQITNIAEALSEGKSLPEILKTLTEQQEEEEKEEEEE